MNFESCSDHLSIPGEHKTDNGGPMIVYQLEHVSKGICQIHWIMEIRGHAEVQVLWGGVPLAQYDYDVPGDWKLVADGGIYYAYEYQTFKVSLKSCVAGKLAHLRNIHVLVKPLIKGTDRRLTYDESGMPLHLQPAMESDAPEGYMLCDQCKGEKVIGPDGEACNCARYGKHAGYIKKGKQDAQAV